MRHVLKMTYQHSRNLAMFVPIYKSVLYLLSRLKGKENSIDSFLAGLIGGYLVFGEDSTVNNQIVLYLFSRIAVGLAKLAVKKQVIVAPSYSFPLFSAVTWGLFFVIVGIVMWLFRNESDTLQSSLKTSMQYLYNDSDRFTDLETLLLKNKK